MNLNKKFTIDNVEEMGAILLPIIGLILVLTILSFTFGYFISSNEGYYEGKSYVYEKILKERN